MNETVRDLQVSCYYYGMDQEKGDLMDEEAKMLLNAILERVKTTDAKIDALTLDVRKLQGDVESLKETVALIDKRLDYQLAKVAKHEEEIYVLKQRQ